MDAAAEGDDGERGETLLELVIAIMILGFCVIAIGSGIAVSVKISDINRSQSLASEFLHNYAEQIQSRTYQPCTAGSPNYVSGLTTPPNGDTWTISQPAVKYWNGSAFAVACPAADPGLQQLTIRLQSGGGLVDESLVFTVRNTA